MPALTNFVSYMINLVGQLGYTGVFIVIGLEYGCFPLPSEVVLPFVGMSIPITHLSFFWTFIVSILAGLTGSTICYLIGRIGGQALFNKWQSRSASLDRATTKLSTWFENYGRLAVMFSRVIPLTRTYISLFAGLYAMNYIEFLLYSATGIAIWNLVLMSLGYYLGNNWELIQTILNTYSNIAIILLAIAVIYVVYKKFYTPRKAAKKQDNE